jgi:RNA polymerase sigma factor (sigma-70 family)
MQEERLLVALEVSDLDLIRRAKTGDRGAFTALYTRHAGHLYATCLRMLADRTLAGELAQEALVKAWQMLSSFREESPFGAWVHRIAVNAVLDYLRSRKRLDARIEFTDVLDSYTSSHEGISAAESIDLEDAIASLPTQARAVLVLHDIEGYRHEEIAGMMGVVEGTSKAQLHRARKLLKERLER